MKRFDLPIKLTAVMLSVILSASVSLGAGSKEYTVGNKTYRACRSRRITERFDMTDE